MNCCSVYWCTGMHNASSQHLKTDNIHITSCVPTTHWCGLFIQDYTYPLLYSCIKFDLAQCDIKIYADTVPYRPRLALVWRSLCPNTTCLYHQLYVRIMPILLLDLRPTLPRKQSLDLVLNTKYGSYHGLSKTCLNVREL